MQYSFLYWQIVGALSKHSSIFYIDCEKEEVDRNFWCIKQYLFLQQHVTDWWHQHTFFELMFLNDLTRNNAISLQKSTTFINILPVLRYLRSRNPTTRKQENKFYTQYIIFISRVDIKRNKIGNDLGPLSVIN